MSQNHAPTLEIKTELELEAQIESLLQEQVRKAQLRSPFKGPTIGLEQEFFVFKSDGATPATLQDTQRFLSSLSHAKGWKTITTAKSLNVTHTTRVSYEHDAFRYTAIKYEFPPHLLEIAFSYYDNACALGAEVSARWSDLERVAADCNLKLVLAPFIAPPALEPSDQVQIDPKLPALAESRRAFYVRRGEPIDQKSVDFPSFMAATQTQVGIPFAWGKSKFMHRLYALELSLLPILNSDPKVCAKRQKYYDGVFRGLHLLGVPNLKEWSLKSWISAICDSPLISNKSTEAKTLRSVWSTQSPIDLNQTLSQARDLQIIRPKTIGTVEFRADASVDSPSKMIQVAATRFAAALLAADPKFAIPGENLSFSEIRELWTQKIGLPSWSVSQLEEAEKTFEALVEILQRRGKGEEKLLARPKSAS